MSDDYQKFYSENKNRLFSYLIYKSGDPDIAQEIMQESFARHFQYYGQEDLDSPTLLYTIARNTLVDAQRYKNKRRILHVIPPQVPQGQDDAIIKKEEIEKVRSAIKRLPEQDRNMLRMAVTGVPYKNIAALYKVSIANVKVRIHRSRKSLQKFLTEEE